MMLKVERGKTLLVDGPARIQLNVGKLSVLGTLVEPKEQIVVRRGKRMPLESIVDCEVELALGDSASYTIIEGDAIPTSWKQAAEKILSRGAPTTVLVVGGVDCGKTAFCTYLANSSFAKKLKIAIVDGDIGQSDIGPPGTVSLCKLNRAVVDLFKLQADELRFIGVTSPSRKPRAVVDALQALKQKALEQSSDLVIVNTDGWIEGEAAVDYKVNLVEKLAPNVIVAVKCNGELAPIIEVVSTNHEVVVVSSPQLIKKRDQETRKLLRESAYKKYLKETKVRSFPLSWIAVDGDLMFKKGVDSLLKKRIEGLTGKEVLFCQEFPNYVAVMVGKTFSFEEEHVKKLESELGKRVFCLRRGDEEGLLISLEDAAGKVLGLGTISYIDFDKGNIVINTAVNGEVTKIVVSQIKLNGEGHEIGMLFENLSLS
ncbi:MAG: Clp1/GlmU family protein [Candidatus Bathyarchaeia archaeon]